MEKYCEYETEELDKDVFPYHFLDYKTSVNGIETETEVRSLQLTAWTIARR